MRNSSKFVVALSVSLLLAGCNDTEKTVVGTIDLKTELHQKISPSAVLFIIAKNANQEGGAPLAVKRFVQPFNFPLTFTLSAQDRMIADTPFEGKMNITARIAQSGSAVPIGAGDIEGTANPNPVEPNGKKITLTLDQLVLPAISPK